MSHKHLKTLLIVSFIINVLVLVLFAGRRYYYFTYLPHHRPKITLALALSSPPAANDSTIIYVFNKAQVDSTANQFFRMLPIQKNDVVFVGNSITAAFPLQEMFHSLHIKNRGINGNRSKDILLRIEDIIKGKPSVICLEIGINDIGKDISNDTILHDVELVTKKIRSESPATRLLVQSVFPTSQGAKKLIPKIEAYNKKLRQYCNAENITYVDLFPVFYKDGGLDVSLTTDGVHFNGKGYLLWKKSITKYL